MQSVHPDNQLVTHNTQPSPTTDINNENASESIRSLRRICSEIDPTRFYFKSTDKNGHSEMARTRIPCYWQNAIDYIIGAMKCYKNRSDFFRDAIIHRIAWIGENVSDIDPHELAIIMSEILAEKEIIDSMSFDAMKKTVEKSIKIILKRRDYKAALVLIKQLETTAAGMNEIYRNRILRRLAQYRKMIDAKKKEMAL